MVLGEEDGEAKGDGEGRGYFRRQVRGALCVAVVARGGRGRGGAAYRAQGSTARAPDARRDGDRGFARERFRHPATRRGATAREGARGARRGPSRGGRRTLGAHRLREDAARANGECARAGKRRLRNVAPPTPGERYSGQPLTGAGRSGRPADRSWIDRRFDRRYPLNARPLATVVSPSNDRATRSNPREKLPGHRVDQPGDVPSTRRIRRFASRTDVARGFIPPAGTPSQNQDRAASRARTPRHGLRQFARRRHDGSEDPCPRRVRARVQHRCPRPARARDRLDAPPPTKLANTLAPAVRPPERGGPRAVERAPRSRSTPRSPPPRAPSASLPPPRACPPPLDPPLPARRR